MAGNCKKTPCLTSEDTAWKKRKTIRTLPSFATVTQQINQPGKNPYKPMTRKSSAPCSGLPAKSFKNKNVRPEHSASRCPEQREAASPI
jgi:hypothetical protein